MKWMRAFALLMPVVASAQDLRITKAEYGHDQRWIDVTPILRRAAVGGVLDIVVGNPTFGVDPAPAEVKSLRIEYVLNGQQMREEVPENTRLLLPRDGRRGSVEGGRLRILSAQYGAGKRVMDVTGMLQSQVRNGFLVARVDPNTMRGDPARGRQKVLSVEYEYMGRSYRTQVPDFSELRLPEPGLIQSSGGPYDIAPPVAGGNYGTLQIVAARYGSQRRMVDVARFVQAYVQDGQLRMRINNDTMGGDPDRGADKFIQVDYTFNGQGDRIQVNEDNDLVLPRPGIGSGGGVVPTGPVYGSGVVILSAGYGAQDRFVDVTRILRGRMGPDGSLRMRINNDTMGGDPVRGPDKVLRVDYQFQGRTLHKDVREGDDLVLP